MKTKEAILLKYGYQDFVGCNPESSILTVMEEYATARLAELEGSGWVKVEDGLPELYRTVLVYCPVQLSSSSAHRITDEWIIHNNGIFGTITHWRELPENPPL